MTKKTKALLSTEIDANVTSSVADDSISPADVGGGMKDIVDSMAHVDNALGLSDDAPRSVSTGANAPGTVRRHIEAGPPSPGSWGVYHSAGDY